MVYITFSDKFREPVLNIIYAFLLGFLIIIPAGYLNYYFIFSQQNPEKLVFIAGFTEEAIKFVTLFFFVIVFTSAFASGFCLVRNWE